MIRHFFILVGCLFAVAACANGKAVKSVIKYPAAEFQITDINIDVAESVDNPTEVRKLLKFASTNLALAYNDTMPLVAPEYVMEVSVQSYNSRPANEAGMRYQVIVRNPNSGSDLRTIPVVFSNSDGEIPRNVMEEGLIEASLPEAFYRLYGLSATPASVDAQIAGQKLFRDPNRNDAVAPAAYSQPAAYSPRSASTTSSGDGPTVITCDVC